MNFIYRINKYSKVLIVTVLVGLLVYQQAMLGNAKNMARDILQEIQSALQTSEEPQINHKSVVKSSQEQFIQDFINGSPTENIIEVAESEQKHLTENDLNTQPTKLKDSTEEKSGVKRTVNKIIPINHYIMESKGNPKQKKKQQRGNSSINKHKQEADRVRNNNLDNRTMELKLKYKALTRTTKSKIWPSTLEPSEGELLNNLDLSKYDEEEAAFIKTVLPVLMKRTRKISKICSQHTELMEERYHVPQVWDIKHTPSIVWCPNYKVGTTTWMTNFLKLAHFNDDNPDILKLPKNQQDKWKYQVKYGARHPVMYYLYPPPQQLEDRVEIFKNSLRMIIVRHPFARILSGYRDKMVKMNPKPVFHHFKELQKEIIKKYRPSNSLETSPYPTFPEFIQHVIDDTAGLKTADDWRHKIKCWTSYWSQCNVCALDYNLIMKLETMDDDQKFLTLVADLKEIKQDLHWRHVHNVTSEHLISDYYGKVTQQQMKQLHQRYLLDFELFHYDIDDYLKVAIDAK